MIWIDNTRVEFRTWKRPIRIYSVPESFPYVSHYCLIHLCRSCVEGYLPWRISIPFSIHISFNKYRTKESRILICVEKTRLILLYNNEDADQSTLYFFYLCSSLRRPSFRGVSSPFPTMPVKQEYYDTPSHVIAAGVVLPLMDIVAIALRFWMRIKQRQGLKTDDWLMIPATVCAMIDMN